jgi:hypothetical protein
MEGEAVMRLLVLATMLSFSSCFGGPGPIRGNRCTANEDLSNCGLCASQPACAWCGSDNGLERGCYDRTAPFVCDSGPVVRLTEACERLTDEQAGLE